VYEQKVRDTHTHHNKSKNMLIPRLKKKFNFTIFVFFKKKKDKVKIFQKNASSAFYVS